MLKQNFKKKSFEAKVKEKHYKELEQHEDWQLRVMKHSTWAWSMRKTAFSPFQQNRHTCNKDTPVPTVLKSPTLMGLSPINQNLLLNSPHISEAIAA